MSLQSAGRAQLAKMRRLGTPGAKTVTFRLFDSVDYDPETGTGVAPVVEETIKVFAASGTAKETRQGSVIYKEYSLIFEDGLLTRVPTTQDEVVIDGFVYKVSASGGDPMDVQLKIDVCLA